MKKIFFSIFVYLPEIFSVIIITGLYILFPLIFERIAHKLFNKNGGNITIVWGIVIGLLSVSLLFLFRLLFPKENNKILLGWPGYKKIKILAFSVVIICFAAVINTFIVWVFKDELIEAIIGLLYCIFTITSIISLLTLIVASISIREIIEKHL